MAHEIEIDADGNASTFYVRAEGTPWHGLGTDVADYLHADEAIQAARLDWRVEKRPVFVGDYQNAGGFIGAPGIFALTRDTDQRVFGTCSDRYTVVNNRDAFDFMDSLIGEGVRYSTAGSLYDGRRVWMLAKLDTAIEPVPGDVTEPYLLLTTTHDGSGAVRVALTTTRVVCKNTLSLALSATKAAISISHIGNIESRIEGAKAALGMARKRIDVFASTAAQLASTPISRSEWDALIAALVPSREDGSVTTRSLNIRAALDGIMDTIEEVEALPIGGTRWAALQAVTHYTSHVQTVKLTDSQSTADEARLNSLWGGAGEALSARAFDLLTTPGALVAA